MAAPKKKPAKKKPAGRLKRPPVKAKAKTKSGKPDGRANNGGHSTKAKKATDKRKRKGPARGKAKHLSKAEASARRINQDSRMLGEHIRGIPLAEIARTHKLKPEVAFERIEARRNNLPRLLDKDAAEIVEDFVTELQVSIGDLEAIAGAALDGKNLSAAVGAKDRANKAREMLKELLQSVGKLPLDLGTLNWVIDIRAVVTEINAVVAVFVRGVEGMPLPEANREEVLAAAAKVTGALDEIAKSPQDVDSLPEDGGDNKGGLEMDGGEHEPEGGELKEGDRISEDEIAKGGDRLDERVREDETPADAEQKGDGGS